MKRRTFVVTREYNEFEPGEQVTPSSPRSVLEMGKVYTVREFTQVDGFGVVFVEGHRNGVDAEYLMTAKEG